MNKKSKPLPIEIIRESLELDPASPTHLRWKARPRHHFERDRDWKWWNLRFAGTAAGSVTTNGHGRNYCQIKLNDILYRSHRIVYALTRGIDPGDLSIDHVDGDGRNNAPANLRLATNSQNQRNRGATQNNTSGRKGVSWDKHNQRWKAYIAIHGRQHHLGYYHSPDAAAAAYARAAAELHGEFARTA